MQPSSRHFQLVVMTYSNDMRHKHFLDLRCDMDMNKHWLLLKLTYSIGLSIKGPVLTVV